MAVNLEQELKEMTEKMRFWRTCYREEHKGLAEAQEKLRQNAELYEPTPYPKPLNSYES